MTPVDGLSPGDLIIHIIKDYAYIYILYIYTVYIYILYIYILYICMHIIIFSQLIIVKLFLVDYIAWFNGDYYHL